MYDENGCSFVPNSLQEVILAQDHELGFPETAPNLTTTFNQSFSLDHVQSLSLSMDQELPYHPLVHNNPPPHVPFPLGFSESVPEAASGLPYDPASLGHNHLSLPPQPPPPLFMELFGSYRNANSVASASRSNNSGVISSLFGGDINVGDEREGLNLGNDVLYDHQDVDQYGNIQFEGNNINGALLDFTMENLGGGFGRGINGGVIINNRANPFATERQRRMQMSGKYAALRELIPNPTKMDRASVVGDAIEYIKELTRTVQELKLLVERKRCGRDHHQDRIIIRAKKHKSDHQEDDYMISGSNSDDKKPVVQHDDDDHDRDDQSRDHHDHDDHHRQSFNTSMLLRSSWLQRKSKDTEVDVRIVEDEVTVKLVQRRKINLLLVASKVLNQLCLDIRHIAGGCIGDSYSFLFNTKICEGSSLYASAIANKLIEVLDIQYAAISL